MDMKSSTSKILPAEALAINDLTALGGALWAETERLTGRADDPRITSARLYRRLWSNHRGFMLLWNEKLQLEADIVLRSGIEATICIAANRKLEGDFYPLLVGDLVATLKGQIKRWRDDGDANLVRGGEAELRRQAAAAPPDPQRFNWKDLADISGYPQFYAFHNQLSMNSSHVTGLSMIPGVIGADGDGLEEQNQLATVKRAMSLRMMTAATSLGVRLHAAAIGNDVIEAAAIDIAERLASSVSS